MVRAQGRHGWRPAHIHFLVGAPGYSEGITALYMADDERSTPIQYSEPMNRSLRNPNRTAQDHPSDRFRAFISISRSPQRKIRRRLRSRDVSAPIHPSS
jgi:protocatechuate 3,4-dioxygenase beta subunit